MDEQGNHSQPVKVIIHGQEYPIRARGEEEYVKRVARYVDEKMSTIQEQTAVNSTLRLAILTALNIADELFITRSEKERIISAIRKRARQISDFLGEGKEDS